MRSIQRKRRRHASHKPTIEAASSRPYGRTRHAQPPPPRSSTEAVAYDSISFQDAEAAAANPKQVARRRFHARIVPVRI
ncbi:hypothetical protein AcW1_009554 [Taiwanofungus camphoratus]|nr:hypothetical protein AcW1_009554 [Antrodia cinnamomea]